MKISADDESDWILEFIVANDAFLELHESFDEVLLESRATQTTEERVLQAQFISRIAFVSSQIIDLNVVTQQRIAEHGNPQCIAVAEASLLQVAEDIGAMVMEIAAIAKRDFMRIPTEFVHPLIEETERLSQSFLNVVMTEVALRNVILDFTETLNTLNDQLEESRDVFSTYRDDIQADFNIKRTQMNYVKAQIFPLLEYSLIYFQQDADQVVAVLEACT